MKKLFLLLILIFAVSCSKAPIPMEIGKDVCSNCKMTIVDTKWGAEIITKTGKIYKFDVVECAIKFAEEELKNKEDIASIWTTNYLNAGEFIDVENAIYVNCEDFHSPMGADAVSLPTLADTVKLKFTSQHSVVKWDELKKAIIEGIKSNN